MMPMFRIAANMGKIVIIQLVPNAVIFYSDKNEVLRYNISIFVNKNGKMFKYG